jgi:hypothetical protein
VIWVPRGDPADPTRNPREADAVAEFLCFCGAEAIEAADMERPGEGVSAGPRVQALLV